MLSDIHQAHKESRWLTQGAWLLLGLGVVLSLGMWWYAAQQWQDQADESFERHVSEVVNKLERHQRRYLDLLSGFRTMFMVSQDVQRSTFHAHFQELQTKQNFPALLAVQYAPLVRQDQRQALEQQVRQDRSIESHGYPDFQIHPEGRREHYLPVVFNEPMRTNLAAFGYDQVFESSRRIVSDLARDSGQPQASPPTPLVQDPAGAAGLLIRVPIYRPEAKLDTVEARRQSYVGQISGIFRITDLVQALVHEQEWPQWHWYIQDVTEAQAPLTVFDSRAQSRQSWVPSPPIRPQDQLTRHIQVAGRQWAFTITRPAAYAELQAYPLALLFGGLVSTLALFLVMRNAATKHNAAADMALELSHKARHSEAHLRSVLDHTIDGIMTLSTTGHLLSVNKAMCAIFGFARSDMVGRHLSLLVPAAARHTSDMDTYLMNQCVGLDGVGHHTEGRRITGEAFPLDLSVGTMDADGERVYIVILRDLSAQKTFERAIQEAQRQLNEVDEMRRVIVHNAPYAIVLLNPHGIIQAINPAGETLLGYPANQLIGRSTTQRFFCPDQITAKAHMLSIRLNRPIDELHVLPHLAEESPGVPTEWNLIRADGETIVAEILVNVLTDEAGNRTGFLAMAHDVTQRRQAEDKLQHVAMHDALTALPNRNKLQEQLTASVTQAEQSGLNMAMMFLDLDRFKKINDTLGHHIGDSVLIEVARRLRSAMRTSDIVARLGGDEFVVLLPRIAEQADGERVARKVLDLFSDPLRVGPHELRVTPSIGLALYPQHGQDPATLMRHADLAMYQAKNAGRNRIEVYSNQMESPTPESLVLENDLYKALERDELRLHFQPQFDCTSGAITGAEALLRWEHGGKLVPPGDFIPLAEETGLIIGMGEWVLRRACHMAQQWRERTGWPLRVAVNLSAVQLEQADIIDVVASALQDTGLPASALELEITESVVVRESLRAADVLNQLRKLGTSIAIDDFGVGYSSFAYLRELPVDRFKLDRSFLSAIAQSEADARIASALIAMAHRLEVGIVAEGVETAEQAAFLKDHGCDECQGFFLGRPMPENRFEALLIEHSQGHQELLDDLIARHAAQTKFRMRQLA
ncbi:MAG: EAL domain-containing protein [Burkholderiales bacterium]|nr:EAL domain-containing protein [Burkholderiales bacterium]